MKRNKLTDTFITCVIFVFSLNACAQEHKKNESRLKSIQEITQSTVLLNNERSFIPITKLAEQNIATINLGFKYQNNFDSLLNKYAQTTPLNAEKYKVPLYIQPNVI